MGEVNYVIEDLKKVENSVAKVTFERFASRSKFSIAYKGGMGSSH
ncbi:hypothetical protein [Myroides odoratimimus]|nr:hypothetical protein [Myroides odoratimimus]